MQVQTLHDGDFAGKRVLVRVDFNVPLKDGKVSDDQRITAALPTIDYLRSAGARVVLCSHLGRPKGERKPEFSLAPVAKHLQNKLKVPCAFVEDCVGPVAKNAVDKLQDGEVLLLENVRFHAGETKNDSDLAQGLANLADLFVNDAFGTAHRAHASNVGVAELLPSFAGFLIEKEIAALGTALTKPMRPFTAVLGGAKVSDKILVIENLIPRIDRLVIGGGMAFTFLKVEGHEVGKSLVEEDRIDLARDLLHRAREREVEVHLPTDVQAANEFAARTTHRSVQLSHMNPNWMGLDIGPHTAQDFAEAVRSSGTVLWNGPMGVFEWPAFKHGTEVVARAAADCKGTVIVGGGDSAAAARQFGVEDKVTHVSTGGGASLEFLEGKALPGLVALEQAAQRMVPV